MIIEVTTEAQVNDLQAVQSGLRAFNEHHLGKSKARIAVFLRDPDTGAVRGGAVGFIADTEILIDWVWVDDALRGQGYGRRLLCSLEDRAVEEGCTRVTLNTFTFQAPDFYPRLGYRKIAEIPDFLCGHTKTYFRKSLL